jgi:hypothetical protein
MDLILTAFAAAVFTTLLMYVFDKGFGGSSRGANAHPPLTGMDYMKIFVATAAGTLLALLLFREQQRMLGERGGVLYGGRPEDGIIMRSVLQSEPDF